MDRSRAAFRVALDHRLRMGGTVGAQTLGGRTLVANRKTRRAAQGAARAGRIELRPAGACLPAVVGVTSGLLRSRHLLVRAPTSLP